jgi:hypothetical protein
MKVPTVHLNGTSKDELMRQLGAAISAVHHAGVLLGEAAPNGRDFYTQGAEAINDAKREHEARLTKLHEVWRELTTIADAVSDQ